MAKKIIAKKHISTIEDNKISEKEYVDNNIQEIVNILKTLLPPEKLEIFNKYLSDQKIENSKILPKRGRPKKNVLINENIEETPETKLATQAAKILANNKNKVEMPKRKPVKLIKVRCRNCNREIEVSENFPGIENFICCI